MFIISEDLILKNHDSNFMYCQITSFNYLILSGKLYIFPGVCELENLR